MPTLRSTNGTQVRFQTHVKGKVGPNTNVIVFHHGHGSSMVIWDETIAALSKLLKAFYFIVVQAPGTGISRDLPVTNGILGLVQNTIEVVDALFSDKQSFVFVGHSMGGAVGMKLASVHPSRVSHLILVTPAPSQGITADAEYHERAKAERAFARQSRECLEAYAASSLRHKPGLLSQAKGKKKYEEVLTSEIGKAEISLNATDEHFSGLWHEMVDLRVDCSRITAQTLMITGAADTLLSDNLKDFRRLRRVATLHVFSRVGHDVPREAPTPLAEVIADFLQHGVVSWRTLAIEDAKIAAQEKSVASLGQLSAMYERREAGVPSQHWQYRGPVAEKAAKSKTYAPASGAQLATSEVCAFYERPELGVASPNWRYRGPVAEAQALAKRRKFPAKL